MKDLPKKGDLRHVIDLPKTGTVKPEPGNVFGVEPLGVREETQAPKETMEEEAHTRPHTPAIKRFFKMLRMPLFIRF